MAFSVDEVTYITNTKERLSQEMQKLQNTKFNLPSQQNTTIHNPYDPND